MSAFRYRLVCSNRPRPQVQSSYAKWGGGGWNRDTHHAAIDDGKPLHRSSSGRTLCGRDARDWLVIDGKNGMTPAAAAASEPHDLCKRCAVNLDRIIERSNEA
jgi:hypothetical protein